MIKKVETEVSVNSVWELFLTPGIIGPFSEGEQKQCLLNIKEAVLNPNGNFLYYEMENDIIGAIGYWENHIANGGYIIENFAVKEQHRNQKIGTKLFTSAISEIERLSPRYISIETGDDSFYSAGRHLYEKTGFKQVSHFPKYYEESSGRIDYFKSYS